MATYLQQNLHFQPCPPSTIKKSFEKVLRDIGAKKAPALGEQCWSLGKNVIFYSTRKTKTGITLIYKVYEEEAFYEEHAKKVMKLINGKAKEVFSSTDDSPEHPRLRSDKIAAYTIGEDVSNGGTSNHQWIWGVIGVISLVLILYFNGVFSSNSSSYSNTSSSYTITSFTSAKDVLNFIDGKSIYTSLGNLYVKNGAVYDGSGAYVNDIIVDSYTTNSATISIYPTQYSGYAMKFKVDRATGTISREN
ncbi:MAG: hypothetical protein U0K81_02380 [Paludibacteraceae bacterium]|nr:hypothetical protein [Paludibacteraceae bacterium]